MRKNSVLGWVKNNSVLWGVHLSALNRFFIRNLQENKELRTIDNGNSNLRFGMQILKKNFFNPIKRWYSRNCLIWSWFQFFKHQSILKVISDSVMCTIICPVERLHWPLFNSLSFTLVFNQKQLNCVVNAQSTTSKWKQLCLLGKCSVIIMFPSPRTTKCIWSYLLLVCFL